MTHHDTQDRRRRAGGCSIGGDGSGMSDVHTDSEDCEYTTVGYWEFCCRTTMNLGDNAGLLALFPRIVILDRLDRKVYSAGLTRI